jgi:3-oxoacyl-[acyl-carrier protein] reductase
MNKIDLNGRCAIVTGGAQGFGRAIAERFVASGAKVAIWDHDLPFAEKTAKEIGADVSAFKVDVSDLAAVEKTRDETLKALGKIDILVNNAGIAGINKTVWETDLDEWRKVLRINLDGPSSAARRWCRRCSRRNTAASSTSPRSPARKATPTPRIIRPRRPA